MQRTHGKLSGRAAVLSGLIAGAVFLILELLLVPAVLGGSPWGPVRMIAAIVLGEEVLLPATFSFGVVATALVVHFILSVVYALVFALFLGRMHLGPALLVGLAGGIVLYIVNFYGFTAVFPWFALARNGVTVFSHLAFGLVTAWAYVGLTRPHGREELPRPSHLKEA